MTDVGSKSPKASITGLDPLYLAELQGIVANGDPVLSNEDIAYIEQRLLASIDDESDQELLQSLDTEYRIGVRVEARLRNKQRW